MNAIIFPAHLCNLQQAFVHYYSRKLFVDTKLVVGNNYMMAHRIILAAASPVLEDILLKNDFIKFDNFNIEVINKMIEYIYTGNIYIQLQYMQEFLELSHFLKLRSFPYTKT